MVLELFAGLFHDLIPKNQSTNRQSPRLWSLLRILVDQFMGSGRAIRKISASAEKLSGNRKETLDLRVAGVPPARPPESS
jgi:hypothetical protein